MVLKKAETESEEETVNTSVGKKKYSGLVRMFREGYLSLCIYKSVYEHKTFYDIAVYRKIKVNGRHEYRRGTNYKPSDLPLLRQLLGEAEEFLAAVTFSEKEATC